jgi:transposase-like protein
MVYPDEFRANAIRRFEEIGSYWRAAKELKVSIATLHRWVKVSSLPINPTPLPSSPSNQT